MNAETGGKRQDFDISSIWFAFFKKCIIMFLDRLINMGQNEMDKYDY